MDFSGGLHWIRNKDLASALSFMFSTSNLAAQINLNYRYQGSKSIMISPVAQPNPPVQEEKYSVLTNMIVDKQSEGSFTCSIFQRQCTGKQMPITYSN